MKLKIRKFFLLIIISLCLFFTLSIDPKKHYYSDYMEYGNSTYTISTVTNYTPTTKMEHYFSKLINIIYNNDRLRCCTLTSLAMIFSYYDTFCYNDIVTEYDTEDETHIDFMKYGNLIKSPGVDDTYNYYYYCSNHDSTALNINYTSICRFSDRFCRDSIFGELVMLGVREGIYVDYGDDDETIYKYNGFGMNVKEKERLLIRYLTFHGFDKTTDYEEQLLPVNTSVYTEQYIYCTIINELSNQRPVLASIEKHSLVIFGYDSNTNQFVCHNGYVVNGQAEIVKISFSELKYIITLKLYDDCKVHSKNYFCTVNGILDDYCGCDIVY